MPNHEEARFNPTLPLSIQQLWAPGVQIQSWIECCLQLISQSCQGPLNMHSLDTRNLNSSFTFGMKNHNNARGMSGVRIIDLVNLVVNASPRSTLFCY